MHKGPRVALCLAILALVLDDARAQSISTSTPVPPLQWIELTSLLGGSSAPPPLKDASIGYDESSRTLLVFGGESQTGLPQSNTYLLNLETLEWSQASPVASVPQGTPPARSAAISGDDFAASNRHAHVIVGGKGADGKPLSDIWEFDYTNSFWFQVGVSPGGPSARFGASGGLDIRVPSTPSGNVPGPNNTLYLAGGYDADGPISLSDAWTLDLSGTLSSNVYGVNGSWTQSTIGDLPHKANQSGTALGQGVIAFGGCTGASLDSCSQDSYSINIAGGTSSPGALCPAPKVGAAMVPNMNTASTGSFGKQVFMLSGLFDTAVWDDGAGQSKGEVDVFDSSTGSWARILPSGDPGSNNKQSFPVPREGAAAVAYFETLVGKARSIASDTIVFGGRDATGTYLSDVWLLRAYNDVITSSGQHSAVYGDGTLDTGTDASGAGVTVSYMAACPSATASPSTSASTGTSTTRTRTSHTPSSTTTSRPSAVPTTRISEFNTSTIHKIMAPVSIAMILIATFAARVSSSSLEPTIEQNKALLWGACLVALAAWGVGIAGLADSFVSITRNVDIVKRSTSSGLNLRTAHGKAGIVLAILAYVILPVCILMLALRSRLRRQVAQDGEQPEEVEHRGRYDSVSTTEKLNNGRPESRMTMSTFPTPSRPVSPPAPPSAFNGTGLLFPVENGRHRRVSSDADAEESTTSRSFEVVNRPGHRRFSESRSQDSERLYPPVMPRSLSDVSWLQRRRQVTAVGELDYALTQMNRAPGPPTPATTNDVISTKGLMAYNSGRTDEMPGAIQSLLHVFLHTTIFALCILSLTALWDRAPKAAFVIFLIYVLAFYIAIIVLAWRGRPHNSILVVLVRRLRGTPQQSIPQSTSHSNPISPADDRYPFPSDTQQQQPHPYMHQPSYHATPANTESEDTTATMTSPRGTRSMGIYDDDDDDEDEDEATRQRRMEEEMNGRDVNVVHVTVPKRRLWITNPS